MDLARNAFSLSIRLRSPRMVSFRPVFNPPGAGEAVEPLINADSLRHTRDFTITDYPRRG